MNRKLRIGILVDSEQIPNWAFGMLNRIVHGNYAEIVLVVKNATPRSDSGGIFQKVKNNLPRLLYVAFSKFDDRVNRAKPDAFEPQDMRKLLPNTSWITVSPVQKSYSDYLTQDDATKIKSYNIDVFIRMGFRILRGEFLSCAKYGIWSYHHGDNRINRGSPPGFWEVMEGWPETGSVLQILTEDLDGGRVLHRSYSRTDSLSVRRNKNNCYWKALSFLPRKLEELHKLGEEEFLLRIGQNNRHPTYYSRKLYSAPNNAKMFGLTIRLCVKAVLKSLQGLLYFNQWILLYSMKRNAQHSSSFWRFKKIIPPKDRSWSDPFIVLDDDIYYVFIEEFIHKLDKGHISYLTIDKNGNYATPKKIIEKPFHISYPFVFSYSNEYYMIPETSQNRTIDLYKCLEFPDKWEFEKTLMAGVHAVDPTMLHRDGVWWLFTNICENEGASTDGELFLFYSSDLWSDRWTPHPENPIVSDVKSARPAGKIFAFDGNLYRPSQDNSNQHRSGIRINQIVTLTESEYGEVCVNEITPMWDKRILRSHTLNSLQGLTIIDGMLRRKKYFSFSTIREPN